MSVDAFSNFATPVKVNARDQRQQAEDKLVADLLSWVQGQIGLGSGSSSGPLQPQGAANAIQGQASAGTSTPQAISSVRSTRTGLVITNTDSTNPVYLGDSNVTSSTGYPLKAGASVSVTNGKQWYAIATGGAVVVGFIDEYN